MAVKVGLNIKSKGRSRVLSIWPAPSVDWDEFLLGVPHVFRQISDLGEFFFFLDPSPEVDGFVNDKLCEITSRHKRCIVARPTSWDNLSEILIRLMDAGRRGVDAFSPAVRGYVPRGGGPSSVGRHWFTRQLRRLNWFCLFWLDKDDQFEIQLCARSHPDNVCARLFQQLTGGDDPLIRARVNRERRRRKRLHSLGLLGLIIASIGLMVLLWSPRSLSMRIIAWVLLAIPPIPSVALLIVGSKCFEGDVQIRECGGQQESPGS